MHVKHINLNTFSRKKQSFGREMGISVAEIQQNKVSLRTQQHDDY